MALSPCSPRLACPGVLVALLTAALAGVAAEEPPIRISGRYPHLAMFNHQGECGTGAVVPWADRLWVITYAPHEPLGSDDKLYEIDANLKRVIRPESVGGTPADRLIHRESKQLIIGPYLIDEQRRVRVIPPDKMPGRLTAVARHLTDPANKVYFYDMEGALYEADVHSLAATKLFKRCAPGAHGKGAYTGQGHLIIANNGDTGPNNAVPAVHDPATPKNPDATGALAEWDGTTWRLVERHQFTDVTGPGGIQGAPEASPVWAIGWDKRSVILKVRDGGAWHTFRLPTADYTYGARHGWYTEWPRIREVAPGKYLMNMHGQWFDFPKSFSATQTGGIRPIASYLKITGDFCGWKEQVVFGCDDASLMDNPLLGQSQSNLWFSTWDDLRKCGRPAGFGGPWVHDHVPAGKPSVPFLLGGYGQRVLHLAHDADQPVTFTLEVDADGHGQWATHHSLSVPAHGYAWYVLPPDLSPPWVRLKTDRDCNNVTAYFHYGPGGGAFEERSLFASLAGADSKDPWSAGTLRPLGGDAGTVLFQVRRIGADGQAAESRSLEVGADLRFRAYTGKPVAEPQSRGAAKDFAVQQDDASVIVTQGSARYRLPVATTDPAAGPQRRIRELATERFLLNAGGSFYVLPRPSAGGALRIKPVCSHGKRITDYCLWRGLLVLAGNRADARPDGHYFAAAAGVGLWFGDLDDLWKLGKPRGKGGPWLRTPVERDRPSDPYLMTGYDRKHLELSHDAAATVRFTVEVDYLADDSWQVFRVFEAPAGQTVKYDFPAGYSAHWMRVRSDAPCRATAQLDYE